uniref:Uncharacterized protein n=1 Tax=Anguilla anguilla TaxID=7936 RepID=A0A0E9PHX5_ANGAN
MLVMVLRLYQLFPQKSIGLPGMLTFGTPLPPLKTVFSLGEQTGIT